jgi:rhamnulokinase
MAVNHDLVARNPSFVAIDLGASSGRVIAGQVADGALRLEEVSRFSTAFRTDSASGYLCWPIDAIEEHIRQGIELASAHAPIASVGVDSWGVDYILLDAGLRRVGEAICYRDSRTEGMIERVTGKMPAAEIYRRTGIQFQPFNTLYQLAATAAQEPEWVREARHLLMIPDFLHYRLSGILSNEYTNATTTQLLSLNGEWDKDLFAAAGLPEVWMQPPLEAGTVLGEPRFAKNGAKVVAPATHDTASAVAGALRGRRRGLPQFGNLVVDGHGEHGSVRIGAGQGHELLQRGRSGPPLPRSEEHHGFVAGAATEPGVSDLDRR